MGLELSTNNLFKLEKCREKKSHGIFSICDCFFHFRDALSRSLLKLIYDSQKVQ